MTSKPRLLDVFCGVGGWSKGFAAHGWHCVGVDINSFNYPGEFIQADALSLSPEFIDGFDAVTLSPPCEEFARAWLPWLRGDKTPAPWAIHLLEWSVALCDRPNRLTECSGFSAHHVKGSVRHGSYRLWGDVPRSLPVIPRGKMKISGKRPDLRAEIPLPLALAVAESFTGNLSAKGVF